MSETMPVSQETYERVALEEDDEIWELHCGRLVQKPAMTAEHNDPIELLFRRLAVQLPEDQYAIRSEGGRLRASSGSNFVPDLFVVPRSYVRALRQAPETFEVYDEPALLVVEVWSRSTGRYDVNTKIPDYRRRGDAEIWRMQPYEQLVTIWRRQPDGTYIETAYSAGVIELAALPGAYIDIGALWAA